MRHDDAIEKVTYSPALTGFIYYDPDPSPCEDDLVHISYNARSRTTLGTEATTADGDAVIRKRIDSGEYIGLPVYAYVHGGATIRVGAPFGDPWDSGRSGYAWMSREDARHNWMGTAQDMESLALAYIKAVVSEFDSMLRGGVYGYVLERDGHEVDSCWGYVGNRVYCRECLDDAATYELHDDEVEAVEAEYWRSRDVMTVSEGANRRPSF